MHVRFLTSSSSFSNALFSTIKFGDQQQLRNFCVRQTFFFRSPHLEEWICFSQNLIHLNIWKSEEYKIKGESQQQNHFSKQPNCLLCECVFFLPIQMPSFTLFARCFVNEFWIDYFCWFSVSIPCFHFSNCDYANLRCILNV